MAVVETAVEAIRSGAYEYVTKPWDNEKLMVSVNNAIKQRKLHSENLQLRRALKERFGYSNIVGKSEGMLELLDLVTQVAGSRSTVLIQGESGTGKELVAKAIHLRSPRSEKPFVPVNSGSMPVDLLESTLFGHVKGAFTNAIAAKKGLFEIADQGTIFLDEIGTIGPETQAKLLRVIQEREFMRLGGTETIKVDVRIIAATKHQSPIACRCRRIQRRPFLSVERHCARRSTPERPPRRHTVVDRFFHQEVLPGE